MSGPRLHPRQGPASPTLSPVRSACPEQLCTWSPPHTKHRGNTSSKRRKAFKSARSNLLRFHINAGKSSKPEKRYEKTRQRKGEEPRRKQQPLSAGAQEGAGPTTSSVSQEKGSGFFQLPSRGTRGRY